ncbi:hypothetical protein ScalyP_jg7182 [Parmales sp. scaly parma]|nr:hypothetical protein ScalyP_jg7182 [Parmales sp. scaly parma]
MSEKPPSTPPPHPAPPTKPSAFHLPKSFDGHIEHLVITTSVGLAVGLTVGTVLFSRGKGWRAASAMAGVGFAAGRSFDRINDSKVV